MALIKSLIKSLKNILFIAYRNKELQPSSAQHFAWLILPPRILGKKAGKQPILMQGMFSSIFFDGNYPMTNASDWSSFTIFIPTGDNYPNIDLLFWDHINQILYPMQITVGY